MLSKIYSMHINGIKKVEYSPLYVIGGNISFDEARIIAADLLSDKITETYAIAESDQHCKISSPILSMIEVWYKKNVTDTVSESIIKAVKDLGISKKFKIKTGHKYYLYGRISKAVLSRITTKLLANTLIQEYKIIK
jgi:phosphoribosylformylglycinamidine synthase